jgi:hypothetical protein
MDPEDREFMRELLLRHEKAMDAMIARLDKGTAEIAARIAQIRRETAAIRRETDEGIREMREDHALFVRRVDEGTREFVAEMRAQRQALFRILERLDSGGASAGA